MDERRRTFIENCTLLFIASRDAEGNMDVSPRGGQPSVLRLAPDGRLLLPDYVGNRRLDTIGNLLSDPKVALLLLNRGADTYLRISALAEITQAAEVLAAFPADENPPLSVIALTPTSMEFVASRAFRDAGFWIDPGERKPPLEVLDIYARDGKWQAEAGCKPVLYDARAERRLVESGLREFYGTPSPLVQTKVYATAGPGFLRFIDLARFVVFAHRTTEGDIAVDITGKPLRLDPDSNTQSFQLDIVHEGRNAGAVPHSAPFAILAAEPGRADLIRLNGVYREAGTGPGGSRHLSLRPDEIYFHCSAAFNRARIWSDSRPVAWSGRRRFVCVSRKRESPDVVSFVFEPRDAAPVGPTAPGQYVTISLPHDERPVPRRRCYSISATPGARSLRITVRRVGSGGISALLHETVEPGDEVLLGPPGGQFVLDSEPSRPVVLVGAGVGVTPLLPMARQLAREQSDRDVWFVHAARNARHHLFREEVEECARANPRFHLITAYSRPDVGDVCDISGRLDTATLARHVPVGQADFYICGPDAFMSSLREGLIELGVSSENIRMEAFEQKGAAGLAPSGLGERAPCKVVFCRSGKEVVWTSESGTLLDLALASGVEVEFSCRNGECQSCAQKVVSGSVVYPSGEEPILPRGQILLCQAVPRGEILIDC